MRMSLWMATVVLAPGACLAEEMDPERISAIWMARESKVRSAEFRWTITARYPKGGYSQSHPFPDQRKQGFPFEDYEYSFPVRLVFEGVRARYDFETINWDAYEKRLKPCQEMLAFDGQFTRSWRKNVENGHADFGIITYLEGNFRDGTMPHLRPIFGAFRGRTRGLASFQRYEFQATGRKQTIDKELCIEVVARRSEGGGSQRLWLAPAMDWLVMREDYQSPPVDGYVTKNETRFKPDPVVGWVPVTWETSLWVHGKACYTVLCRVDHYQFNQPVSDIDFAPRFPPGLGVHDRSRPGSVRGAILADGRFQPEDLSKRAYYLPGEVGVRKWRWTRIAIGSVLAICLVLTLARMLIRRRRMKQSILNVPPATS